MRPVCLLEDFPMKKFSFDTAALVFCSIAAFGFAHAADDLFVKLDTNSDGVISKVEAQSHEQLSKLFDSLDLDKDGVLSGEEFVATGLK